MIRKVFKKKKSSPKLDAVMKKYKIPRDLLSINRKMVSRAMLVGLFIAMIPMPLQMLAVILIAPFFRFNVPIGVSLVWITNPFTMPFIYYIEYTTGNILLMQEGVNDIHMTLDWFKDNITDIFIPFYSLIFSVAGYYLVNWLWIISVGKEKKQKDIKRKENNGN